MESLAEGEAPVKFNNHTITRRNDGRYCSSYVDNAGKRRYIYAKKKMDCYNRLKDKLKEEGLINKQGLMNRQVKQPVRTLNSWIEEWFEVFKEPKNQPATIHKQIVLWQKWIYNQLGKQDIKKFTTLQLQQYLNTVKLPRQKEHIYTFIKDVFNKAFVCSVIDKNPAALLEAPRHEHKERKALTSEEEKRLVAVLQQDIEHWQYLCFILYEGMRPGEVLALRHSDIKAEYIYISQAKDELGNYKTTKNNKPRRIPIFPQAKTVCDSLRSSSNEYIWAKYKHGFCQNVLYKACASIDLKGVSLYTLRHTFCTRCVESNISAKQVQLWMGHSDVSVTLKYYTNINEEFEQQNVAKKK